MGAKDNQKVYGVLNNGELVRTVKFKKHFYWQYKGYALGVPFLKRMEKKGEITILRIVEEDTGKIFSISYQEFKNNSMLIQTKFGQQRVIPIQKMELENGTEKGSIAVESKRGIQGIPQGTEQRA